MRECYDRRKWLAYHNAKMQGWPYSGTAAFQLDDPVYGRKISDKPSFMMFPYWAALEMAKEGDPLKKSIADILNHCKEKMAAETQRLAQFTSKPEMFRRDDGSEYPLEWEYYRPYDEDYNSYDQFTQRCILPFKVTEEEKAELREGLWVHFRDPYCDGRDCTGAPFTSWIQIYTTAEKTFIYHKISLDL